MHDPLPLLSPTQFPGVRRAKLDTLQINLGYKCNQSCVHCHVSAGPNRTEEMTTETARTVIDYLTRSGATTLDITGGAPELNANFRYLVSEARRLDVRVIDRCNLTVLELPEQDGLAEFLAENDVEITASLPCYLEDNVDSQRGKGVYQESIAGLRRLNALGYGRDDGRRVLNLVYNPLGPSLPPSQESLTSDYRRELKSNYGVEFTELYTLANMPVGRYGSTLISKGQFAGYLELLKSAHKPENVDAVMCRGLISVDWQGYVFDCDFNQMLGLPFKLNGATRVHLSDLTGVELEGRSIVVRDHCFGCTAGQGSSCGGALN